MPFQRLIRESSLAIAAAISIVSASSLSAQGRELFEWSGRVDREVQISIRGRDSWTRGIGRDDRGRAKMASAMPRAEGRVYVAMLDGRGDVKVIQQPTYRNDYTAIVRIRDGRSGSDRYRLRAYWQPTDGRWDNGNYGDDRYDRPRQDRGRSSVDTPGRDYDERWNPSVSIPSASRRRDR